MVFPCLFIGEKEKSSVNKSIIVGFNFFLPECEKVPKAPCPKDVKVLDSLHSQFMTKIHISHSDKSWSNLSRLTFDQDFTS